MAPLPRTWVTAGKQQLLYGPASSDRDHCGLQLLYGPASSDQDQCGHMAEPHLSRGRTRVTTGRHHLSRGPSSSDTFGHQLLKPTPIPGPNYTSLLPAPYKCATELRWPESRFLMPVTLSDNSYNDVTHLMQIEFRSTTFFPFHFV